MPKSKEMISDSEESGSHSEEEVKKKTKPKRQAKKKQESSDGSESEEEVKQKSKPKKVAKKDSSGSGSESDDVKSKKRPAKGKEDKGPNKKAKTQTKNDDGEEYWDLGGHKRVTVRSFKGKLLIDIREFYIDGNGEEKPGKKGIALQAANWKALLSVIDEVDQSVKEKAP